MAASPSAPQRILLITDHEDEAAWINRLISADSREQFALAASTAAEEDAISQMENERADLVLVDFDANESGGIDFLRRLAEAGPLVPILVLTESTNEDLAIEVVKTGAQDCLTKANLSSALLLQAMRYAVERVRVETALSHERDLLYALLDSIPDRIYFKDRRSRFLRISAAQAKFFGIDRPEKAVGKTDFDFFTAEHAQPAFEDEKRVLETGQPIVGKIEKETLPDGRIGWAHTTKLPLRNRKGEIVGTCGISRDITDLIQLEDALAAERNLLRSVIDNVPDPIFVKDLDGRYLISNTAHAHRLSVESPQQVVGKTAADFIPRESAQIFRDAEAEVFSTARAHFNREEKVELADGSVRWLVTTRVPLREPDGRIRSLVCIGRDITAQKYAQQELETANANLCKALEDLKNAHRELRDVQLQLIEAEKMKSIGRLAAGIAHEVKNPLATISLGLEFLEGQACAQDALPSVIHELRDAVGRADAVIMGLLDFSTPRSLELQAHDLNNIIDRALVLVKGEAKAGALRIKKQLGDLPMLKLDPLKIEQVFINIFTNAIHAMEGRGTLTVRTRCEQITRVGSNISGIKSERFHAGEQVVVAEILDSGPGIPEDRLGKIFEPFYTTKPTGKGTGLGMTVVKSIIDLHGGTVEIGNRKEGGVGVTLIFKI